MRGKLFLPWIAATILLAELALAMAGTLEADRKKAVNGAGVLLLELFDDYERHAGRPNAAREDGLTAVKSFIREREPEKLARMEALRQKADDCRYARDIALGAATAGVGLGLLFAFPFVARLLAWTVKTRGQRAGAVLLATSAVHPVACFCQDEYLFQLYYLQSDAFTVSVVLAGAGVLLLLRLPQRLLSWIAGGTKD